jgi:chromate transporter
MAAFGGGIAVIALIQRECAERRQWVSAGEFLHGVSMGHILGSPGVNMSFFVGYRLRGIAGGLAAMTAFLAPSVATTIVLSWLYFRTGRIPALQQALHGFGPVVIALIVAADVSLAKTALRRPWAWAIAVVGFAGTLAHLSLPMLLLLGGLVGYTMRPSRSGSGGEDGSASEPDMQSPPGGDARLAAAPLALSAASSTAPVAAGTTAAVAGAAMSPGLLALTLMFLKIGCVFVGGGYVLIALLQHELVSTRHLLTAREFVDGLAISQLTPGPVAVLATFVGFRFCGLAGAILSTIALYLPATVLMAVVARAYAQVGRIHAIQDVLAGMGAAIVGMIFASAVILAPANSLTPRHPLGMVMAIASYLLVRRGWHPALLLAAGALLAVTFPRALV